LVCAGIIFISNIGRIAKQEQYAIPPVDNKYALTRNLNLKEVEVPKYPGLNTYSSNSDATGVVINISQGLSAAKQYDEPVSIDELFPKEKKNTSAGSLGGTIVSLSKFGVAYLH